MSLVLWRKVHRGGANGGWFITKQRLTRRHHWCVEQRRIVANFVGAIVCKVYITFVFKDISNLHTTPLSALCAFAPLWDGVHLRVPPFSTCYITRNLLCHFIFRKNQQSIYISISWFCFYRATHKLNLLSLLSVIVGS